MLERALDRVADDRLGQAQLLAGGQALEAQQRVGATVLERDQQVVAREGHVHRRGAVAVQNGRHLVGAADPTSGALAELGTGLCGDADLGHGGALLLLLRIRVVLCGRSGARGGATREGAHAAGAGTEV